MHVIVWYFLWVFIFESKECVRTITMSGTVIISIIDKSLCPNFGFHRFCGKWQPQGDSRPERPLLWGVATPEGQYARATARPWNFFISCSLHFLLYCHLHLFIFYFYSCCFHAHVFGKTLVHESIFFYSLIECNLLSSFLGDRLCLFWLWSAVKLNAILII